ncbi:MAG: glycosyltransferase family 4 protein [Sphingomonadaceae bacterium]|nr:glycosyltransferase family 4 protein [Sphingomonadaceae bacterium]
MNAERIETVRRVALIGNHPPRLCGIATFTCDLYSALSRRFPQAAFDIYAMNDRPEGYDYPSDVVCTVAQNELSDYVAAAHRINESAADIVCVQHEYGIFGGSAGAYLLKLLDRVQAPVVVTLHTVLEQPNADQRAVIEALVRRAAKLVVMAEKGREILMRVHGVAADRIAVIPHGVPDRPFIDPDTMKPQFDRAGRRVLLTFGLLSPNKGIETMIRAMPAIVAAHPDVLYVVLGATHPHLVAREGEAYRDGLIALAEELGVADHVRFVDGFAAQDRLLDHIAAADIYVTPYLNEAQITSGTLAYAIGLGKPVVSTPYWHAAELLADGVGELVPFGEARGFAERIIALLDDPERMSAMRERAYAIGRSMTWERAAETYMRIFQDALLARPARLFRSDRPALKPQAPRLDAIERLTDSCGMMQHSIFSVPDRNHGYCVDDNARALMLMHRIGGSDTRRADELATVYASFVQFAWNGQRGRFRNFMGYDRQWLEDEGSEDSFGRSLWCIGATAAEARRHDLRRWGLHLFDQVAPHALELAYQRSWAFAILGADALLDAYPSHGVARQLIADLGRRLAARLRGTRRTDWRWFEPTLGYDNARLPEALIRAGRRLADPEMIADGFDTLDWLDAIQTSEGRFRAVGTDSFGRPFQAPLPFDQQPLEAWATVDAALFAEKVSGDPRWREVAIRAHTWYLGANDLSLPIASTDDGGCFDGLMSDRVNLNQGAESVLAYQFACCAMASLQEKASAGGRLASEAATS